MAWKQITYDRFLIEKVKDYKQKRNM